MDELKKLKKRFSVGKAEWSDSREEQYRKESQDIVFGFGDSLKMTDTAVYIIRNDEQIEIAKPHKAKTYWFESWLKIKEYYGI